MINEYTIRRAHGSSDGEELSAMYDEAFHPENVGTLAKVMYDHLPGLTHDRWFIAEHTSSGDIAAALVMIPWVWQLDDIRLRTAEMGIVATKPEHRGKGLMNLLNTEFDRALENEGWDLAVIQGIPGFYQKYGYHYTVPLENHISVPLNLVPDGSASSKFQLRSATEEDIPLLEGQDELHRQVFSLAAVRDAEHWKYMLTHSLQTEYGSEFWILENRETGESYYFRIPFEGFGEGLIVSEVSENIPWDAFQHMLDFCRDAALERQKPYIRLNVHNLSAAGQMAVELGARPGTPYAWQIKIQDPVRLLARLMPVLERRVQSSPMRRYDGRFRLHFYTDSLDLVWKDGMLTAVEPADAECRDSFAVPGDLFPVICLGYQTWRDLRTYRPDLIPSSDQAALLMETLFPRVKSWIHEQY